MKRGLVKAFASNHLAELGCFPAVLEGIVGGIHQKRMTMPVGINLATNRPGRAMDETGPDCVAGGTIFLCLVYPYPGLNSRLHIVKSFPERLVNELFDLGVLSPRQVHADRLRDRKREIHAYAPIRDFFLDRDFGLGRLVQFPHDSGPSRVVPGGEPLTRAWRKRKNEPSFQRRSPERFCRT